jgi:hypothetical protein
MNINDRITRRSDLINHDSLSAFDNLACQQTPRAFEVFYEFLKEIKPKRILEIGTSLGGFTSFLNRVSIEENLNYKILTYDINNFPWYDTLIKDGIDLRIEDIFDFNNSTIKKEVSDFINEDGITLVLCDGGNKKEEFRVISKYLKTGDFIMAHDYAKDDEKFQKDINLKVWNWHEIQESDIEIPSKENGLEFFNQDKFDDIVWVCKIKTKDTENNLAFNYESSITLVTGLWD